MIKNIKKKLDNRFKNFNLKKNIKYIILILLMFTPIIIEIINNNRSLNISYAEYEKIILNGDPAIIYFDSKESFVKKTIINNLKIVAKKSEVLIKNIDYEALNDKQKANLINLNSKIINGPALAFINKGVIIDVRNGAYSEAEIVTLYNKYFSGEEEDINYKIAGSADDFSKLINDDNITMVIFSASSCSFFQKYKPIINKLALSYTIDIYNFDFEVYDNTEFQKILAKNYTVPAQSQSIIRNNNEKMTCTSNGKDSYLINEYRRTPLSLFFKNGKVIDCISGYVDEETLEAVFKFHKIVKKIEK